MSSPPTKPRRVLSPEAKARLLARRARERKEAAGLRRQIIPATGWCEACGWTPPDQDWRLLDLHHVRRISNGGKSEPDNLVVLCPTCHRIADRLTPEQLKRRTLRDKLATRKELVVGIVGFIQVAGLSLGTRRMFPGDWDDEESA